MRVRQSIVAGTVVAIVGLHAATPGAAPRSDAQVCEAAKINAAGRKQACLAAERAKEVKGRAPNYARCDERFMKSFTKAETKAGPGVCPSEGDAAAIEALVDSCFDDLRAALAGSPNEPCVAFPATGAARCWNPSAAEIPCAGTGQDGDIRAGAALSFIDNGDGTITDNNTGLMWEKKSLEGDVNTNLSHRDRLYSWDEAFSVHIAGLNGGSGFAGYNDWRVPNVKELLTLINYEFVQPAVSPAFNTGCVADCTVLTCSCTGLGTADHWSSTSSAFNPGDAWTVGFFGGNILGPDKSTAPLRVRAVRGGL
jgi:hypothetical protein